MKLLLYTFLYCCLALLPLHTNAAFFMPAHTAHTQVATYEPGRHSRHYYNHPHHFNGHAGNGFTSTFSLTCSLLGTAGILGAIIAAVLAQPAILFVAGTYLFSILGIVFGFISHSDRGDIAVAVGFGNLMALSLAGAIYRATKGDYGPLARLFRGW